MVAPRRSARIRVRPPAVWTKPLRRSEGPEVRRARDSRRRQQAQPPEGAVRARGTAGSDGPFPARSLSVSLDKGPRSTDLEKSAMGFTGFA
ncbi:hypothetical protein MG293_014405 [Ovis ammon polii]|uniref:Uncharacterized protein n=1 Tax=Ovis ammon polii TaxID=230172 RepID=A0AAD4Y508_OVIAM|nr:hypothetical protein MG293_014405 [Ovis ammon polii]